MDESVYRACVEGLRNVDPTRAITYRDLITRKQRSETDVLVALRESRRDVPVVRFGEVSAVRLSDCELPVEIDLHRTDMPTERAVLATMRILRRLTDEGAVREGVIARGGGDSMWLPRLPVVETRSHAIVATDARIAEDYEDVEAFWSCWDAVERLGEYRLATRAIDAVESADYLARVQDGHRAMARLARPRRARYFQVSVLTEEARAVYMQGESRLLPVAYFDTDARAEFSCVLGEAEHIPGWEIDGLHRWIRIQHALPDGSPLREVRVTFAHEHQARVERRPLLDIGARVFFLADTGSITELTD